MTQARDLADGKFDTNTLVVDAANNRVGIGTASPDKMLTLEANNDTTGGFPNNVLRFKDSDTATVSGQPAGAIEWHTADTDNSGPGVVGKIQAAAEGTGASYNLQFHCGNVGNFNERLRILSGGGLTFNGDTAGANALDDYEEGTFTPVAIGETTAGSGTYNYQVGEYVKIGKLVHFQISIQWSSHSGSGALRIQNLPFTSDSTTNNFASISAYISELPVTSNHRTMPFIRPNVTYININQASGSGGPSSVGIDAAAQVLVSGSYLST